MTNELDAGRAIEILEDDELEQENEAMCKSLFDQVAAILQGIDAEESANANGWWETSEGAKFGAEKLRKLRALLEARAGQPVGVPDGWKLVPVALTEKMYAKCHLATRVTAQVWSDLLAAAPAAPTVKAEQVDCLYCQGHGEVTRTSGQTAETYSEHNEECPECNGTGLAPSLPAAGSADLTASQCACGDEYPANSYGAGFMAANNGICENCDAANRCADGSMTAAGSAVEEVEVVGYLFKANRDATETFLSKDGGFFAHHTREPLMTVAQNERIVAALSAQQSARQPELTVWEGPMPESNGKSNFTAVLMRKGANLFDGIAGGMTIARSEYPDRVRYEADCVRWLIGELDNEPCIIDYDADKHSGYVAQQSAPERVSVPRDFVLFLLGEAMRDGVFFDSRHPNHRGLYWWRKELRALLASHGRGEA